MHSACLPAIRRWLLLCAGLVALIVVVGGLTRLTESGLSIVEWKPVAGILPPLTAQGWENEFAAYRQTPQYLKVNAGMSLGEFQSIFWLEYIHRLLGRLIGVVFFFPFLYFLYRRALSRPLVLRLAFIFLLGGLQGAVGWWMVTSGLVNDPMVSPLRLAFHLGMAFLIYGLLVQTWLQLSPSPWKEEGRAGDQPHEETPTLILPPGGGNTRHEARGTRQSLLLPRLLLALIFVQILLGALVAGWDAGLAYNTFPLMDGRLVPHGLMQMDPWWRNLLANTATVQWNHRVLATLLLGVSILYCHAARHDPVQRRSAIWLLAALVAQYLLGVATLLLQVPTALASLHQAMALVVFTAAIMATYPSGGKN